ncbi:hypothetical protein ACFSJY_06280 [Thalassotalea euphylliae]|uniref:hypothetical protein n=1 Tax=Thalassotalea euphylliae TaxID=1655234 RepID=UPI00363901FE
MKKRLLLLLAVTLLSTHVEAKPHLLYHQSKEAKQVWGSLEDLIQAIREGKTIRIYMNLGFVEHLMDAGFISIIGDNVYAQIDGIQAQRPDPKANTITLRPYARHVGFYSTLSPYEMKWYAVD